MYDFDGNVIWTHQFGSRLFDIVLDLAPVGNSVYGLGDTALQDRSEPDTSWSPGRLPHEDGRRSDEPAGEDPVDCRTPETLSDAGSLGPQDFDSLVKSLEDALVALNQGNKPVAKQQLGAFIGKVETLERSGWLAIQ